MYSASRAGIDEPMETSWIQVAISFVDENPDVCLVLISSYIDGDHE